MGMMAGAFAKDMLRCWVRGWKRFVSIVIIVMLGVAVLTGIYAGCRDMFRAADRFYAAQGLHDIEVLSTYGLTDDDVDALRGVDGVAVVQAERSQSVETTIDGTVTSVTMRQIGDAGLDRPYLSDGRMPSATGEIAVTRDFLLDSGLKIGDTLNVEPTADTADSSADSSDDAADADADADADAAATPSGEQSPSFPTDLTIVGEVIDPKDLSNPDGIGTEAFRQNVAADYTFFTSSDGVTGDVYTSVTLAVSGTDGTDAFSDAYDDIVAAVADRIEDDVQADRQQARRDQLVADAQSALDAERADAETQLDDAQRTIDDNRATLDTQRAALAAAIGADAADAQLTDATARLDAAQRDLDTRRADADTRFADAQHDIDAIGEPTWYVQTRASISGFSAFDSDVSSIESIGRAFPVVFLLVAVLMSLTAMTRMVEEERGLIGTYVGLGYGRAAIAARYVLFAALACLVGGGLGLVAGFVGIPAFLLIVLKGLYTVPGIRFEYDWLYGTGGVVLFVAGVVGATVVACMGELRQTPAALMRPKAPKAGARVLLERIGPLWRRLSFLNKVTVRNIARFKSRLVMTVGGVAGCTALIVCGFAINDSIDTIGAKQYGGITRYDLLVVAGDGEEDAMRTRVADDGRVDATLDLRVDSGEMTVDGAGETVQLMIVPDGSTDALGDMIDLRDAADGSRFGRSGGGDALTLGDDGAIVAQSAANALGVEAGDTIRLRDSSMRTADVTVAAVSRNLIGSDVYLSETLYRDAFGVADAVTWNAMLATLADDGSSGDADAASGDAAADAAIAYAEDLARDPSVTAVSSSDRLRRGFRFELMSAVVALIVGLAGSLALVVLFTLSNTNVSERVREMATLKVLGFYDREVHTYVNKEMLILTGMGVAVGLPLGRWVGGLLTAALNMPGIYFEVEVRWSSYLIAAAVTFAFALLVHLFTNPVLDRIDPVSSLKSVE